MIVEFAAPVLDGNMRAYMYMPKLVFCSYNVYVYFELEQYANCAFVEAIIPAEKLALRCN